METATARLSSMTGDGVRWPAQCRGRRCEASRSLRGCGPWRGRRRAGLAGGRGQLVGLEGLISGDAARLIAVRPRRMSS